VWPTDDDFLDDEERLERRPRRRFIPVVLALGWLPRPPGRRSWTWGAIVLGLTLGAMGVAGTGYVYEPLATGGAAPAPEAEGATPREMAETRKDYRAATAALKRRAPASTYIVIDQANNRLYLRRGQETLLDAVCSAGSGWLLRDVRGGRQWVFDTPRGRFEVRSRVENPVWRKPDWAFIESGEAIPNDPGERIEYGSLGEYALTLRDGYMIHGTLYERLLGRSVTHGCVRLGRDDLRTVWRATRVGTPVYIF